MNNIELNIKISYFAVKIISIRIRKNSSGDKVINRGQTVRDCTNLSRRKVFKGKMFFI